MPLKKTITELCPRCGQIQAVLEPDGSIKFRHNCPNQPPGPYSIPVTYKSSEAVFVPAEKPSGSSD